MTKERRWIEPGDVLAGLTVAVFLVPQGMAYAVLAGLDPIRGLYAAIAPLAVYSLLGSSRSLAVGPIAIVSLMVGTAPPEQALTLAFLAGILLVAMGLLGLGRLTALMTPPVVSGFTSAAAVIIIASQVGGLMGVPLPRTRHITTVAQHAVASFGDADPATIVVGMASMGALVALRRWRPAFPGALLVVLATTVVGTTLDLSVDTIGQVPAGLPGPALPDLTDATALIGSAASLALVIAAISAAVAKKMSEIDGRPPSSKTELLALGAANMAAAFTGAYPVAGGLARSAVNHQAGARTPRAGLVAAGFVAITVQWFTPWFSAVPIVALSAIIVVAASGLVDPSPLNRWRERPACVTVWAITLSTTLAWGVEWGLFVGVVTSGVRQSGPGPTEENPTQSRSHAPRRHVSGESDERTSRFAPTPLAAEGAPSVGQ